MREKLVSRNCWKLVSEKFQGYIKRTPRYILLILWPPTILLMFYRNEGSGALTLQDLCEVSFADFPDRIYLPHWTVLEIWTMIGTWMVIYFLPYLRQFATAVREIRIGNIGVISEINEIKGTSSKAITNDRLIHTYLLAYQKRWEEAKDILLLLRNSTVPNEKVTGLVESAHLLVQIYDDESRTKMPNELKHNLDEAINFCNTALWLAKSTDDISHRIPFVYFRRAIVYSRIALTKDQEPNEHHKYCHKALQDLKEAVTRDRTILTSVPFDKPLSKIAHGKDFELNDSKIKEAVKYEAKTEKEKLRQRFLTLERREVQ